MSRRSNPKPPPSPPASPPVSPASPASPEPLGSDALQTSAPKPLGSDALQTSAPKPLGSDALQTSAPASTPRPPSEPSGEKGSDQFQTGAVFAEGKSVLAGDSLLLGRFRLLGLLGRGGMAEVWEALDTHTGDVVALKRLHPSLFSKAAAQERFLREIEGLQRLRHPSIVRFHAFFPEGMCFSMERLVGKTLRAFLQEEGRLPLLDALRLLDTLLDALQATHREGIIHRDLKPENLFLCGSPPWTLKLLDFGILLLAEGTRFTETRAAGIGTAYYMAPEQLEGRSALTVAVDVYACGALLYEMLTGRIFQGNAPPLHKRYQTLAKDGLLSPAEWPPELQTDLLSLLETLEQGFRRATAYEPLERLSLTDFQALLRSHLSQIQTLRKNASDQRWQKAQTALASQPPPDLLATDLAECLSFFPEREDIQRWSLTLRELWDGLDTFAQSLHLNPPLDLEDRLERWNAMLPTKNILRSPSSLSHPLPHADPTLLSLLAQTHPSYLQLQRSDQSITQGLSENLALCETQGFYAALDSWKACYFPSPQDPSLWDRFSPDLPSKRLRLHFQRLQADLIHLRTTTESLRLLPPDVPLERIRKAWRKATSATLSPKGCETLPFAKALHAEELRLAQTLEESQRLAFTQGPGEALRSFRWEGRSSDQIEPWLESLREGLQYAEEAASSLQASWEGATLEEIADTWARKAQQSPFPSAFDGHPFQRRLKSAHEACQDLLNRWRKTLEQDGPDASWTQEMPSTFRSQKLATFLENARKEAASWPALISLYQDALQITSQKQRQPSLCEALVQWQRKLPTAFGLWKQRHLDVLRVELQKEEARIAAELASLRAHLAEHGIPSGLQFLEHLEPLLPPDTFKDTHETLVADRREYDVLRGDALREPKRRWDDPEKSEAIQQRLHRWVAKGYAFPSPQDADFWKDRELETSKLSSFMIWRSLRFLVWGAVIFAGGGLLLFLAPWAFNGFWEYRYRQYEALCKKGQSAACRKSASAASERGRLAEADNQETQALQWFTLACQRGDGNACLWIGDMKAKAEDDFEQTARSWYVRACSARVEEGCRRLSVSWQGKQIEWKKGTQAAFLWFSQRCLEGIQDGCAEKAKRALTLGEKAEASNSWDQAVALYKEACRVPLLPACDKLRTLALNRAGEEEKAFRWAEAEVWYKHACEGGANNACSQLSVAGKRRTFSIQKVVFAARYVPRLSPPSSAPSSRPSSNPSAALSFSGAEPPFWMLETEVTQEQYAALVSFNPSFFSHCGPSCPVENVSWRHAAVAANALSRVHGLEDCYHCKKGHCKLRPFLGCRGWRLPTEAEWSYAARASGTPFPPLPCRSNTQANFDSRSALSSCPQEPQRGEPIPVKQFPPNAWGLYDLFGNVAEWTSPPGFISLHDSWGRSENTDRRILKDMFLGDRPGRRAVGGSWKSRSDDLDQVLESPDGSPRSDIGFRLLRLP